MGSVALSLAPIGTTITNARVCIRNVGHVPMELYGEGSATPSALWVAGQQQNGLLTFIWYGGESSYLSHLPTIAHHADTGGTQVAGPLTLWLALALVTLALASALFVTVRESDR